MSPWIVSRRFDLAWLILPGLLPLLAVGFLPAGAELAPWGFLLLVVGVDVAHVWSTLYRTYLDPEELARRRFAYLFVPSACLTVGSLLHRASPILFWRVLAYLAVLHFVRQQVGMVRLYRHRMGETGKLDDVLDRLAIYAATLYPILWWHLHPRAFAWFVPGDFLKLAAPVWLESAARALWIAVLAAFFLRQLKSFNPGKCGIVAATAVSWYGGIVLLNSDVAFTATNVVAHGVPYVALVWLYSRRKREATRQAPWRLLPFLLLLLAIAYLEEGVWDAFVWQEHPTLFGDWGLARVSWLVPLLALPQATHYVLDALIWRFDPKANPGLREYLFSPAGGTPRTRPG